MKRHAWVRNGRDDSDVWYLCETCGEWIRSVPDDNPIGPEDDGNLRAAGISPDCDEQIIRQTMRS